MSACALTWTHFIYVIYPCHQGHLSGIPSVMYFCANWNIDLFSVWSHPSQIRLKIVSRRLSKWCSWEYIYAYTHLCVCGHTYILCKYTERESSYFLSIMFTYIHMLPHWYNFGSERARPLDVWQLNRKTWNSLNYPVPAGLWGICIYMSTTFFLFLIFIVKNSKHTQT